MYFSRVFILVSNLLFAASIYTYGQGELDEQKQIFYRDERTFAILLNTNGWGFDYRYAKRVNAFRKNTYNIDFARLKHPKEKRSPSVSSYQTYVYGKLNEFFIVRGGIGQQFEKFPKVDKGGISIRYFYNTGIDIGLLKPVYYVMVDNNENVTRKFDSNPHATNNVQQPASFFKGIGETAIRPGIYAKVGVDFEFSTKDHAINAIEGGLNLDAFPYKMPIMSSNEHNYLFFSVFIAYRFGRVLDVQTKTPKNKIERLLPE